MLKKGKVQGELDHGEVLRGGGTPWTGARRPWEVPAHKPEGGAPMRAWSCCWAPARRSFCAASKAGEVELAPMEGEGQGAPAALRATERKPAESFAASRS
jgi:hypothetical protein